MPVLEVVGEPLPPHLTTLEGYAPETGRPWSAVRSARCAADQFPAPVGALRGRGHRGRGKRVYLKSALAAFFATWPTPYTEPLPAGLATLQGYAALIHRSPSYVGRQASKPGLPTAVGDLPPKGPSGKGARRQVYRIAELDAAYGISPGDREMLKTRRRRTRRHPVIVLADRDPEERITVTGFARDIAHVTTTAVSQHREDDGFPVVGEDRRCRLGDLVDFWNTLVKGSGGAVHRRPDVEELGRRLAAARTAAGLGQQALATLAGYKRSAVSEAEIGRSPGSAKFWVAVDGVLGARGALVRLRAQITAGMDREPCNCSVWLGAVPCGRRAAWHITIPATTGRIELGVCEACRPVAWDLAVRLHPDQVGQKPVYAAGYRPPAGVCSCCGDRGYDGGAPPSCAACAGAGCSIEQGLRRCGAHGPPPFLAAHPGGHTADQPTAGHAPVTAKSSGRQRRLMEAGAGRR